MDIVCAWCGVKTGEKPGDGVTGGICLPCQAMARLNDEHQTTARGVRFLQVRSCRVCGITNAEAALLHTKGTYICFPCLPGRYPNIFRHLVAWVLAKRGVRTP